MFIEVIILGVILFFILQYNGSVSHWWLRSALSNYSVNFYKVDDTGDSTSNISSTLYGVSPAFRLG